MKSFIIKGSKDGFGQCNLCSPQKSQKNDKKVLELATENIYNHILNSNQHEFNTPKQDLEKLEQLRDEIRKVKAQKKKKSKEKTFDMKNNYFEFISYCLKENLTFSQIANIGQYLHQMALSNQSGFLSVFSFTEKEIAKITQIIGSHLINQIKEEISQNKFSFSIDSVSNRGENLCAIRVKYLEEFEDQEKLTRTRIKNRLVGLTALKESSFGKDYFNIVEENLFHFDKKIEENLVGFTHDNASNLSGSRMGLSGLLRQNLNHYFFDLPDPCHCLNLAVSKAVKELPNKITNFIDSLHNHFISPQRKASLGLVQQKQGKPVLLLRHYVKHRWLSLGTSLERVIEIWSSLAEYMDCVENEKTLSLDDFDFKKFKGLFEDQAFYLQIVFLSTIMNKMNEINMKFQSPTMEIHKLKSKLNEVFQWVCKLIIIPEKIPKDLTELMNVNWTNKSIQEEWFMKSDDFLVFLAEKVETKLEPLILAQNLNSKKQEFATLFQNFLAKLLKFLSIHLSLKDEVVQLVDFVELKAPPHILENKILKFNNLFHIFPKESIPQITQEITKLVNIDITKDQVLSKNPTLHLWDRIERISNFKYLPMIFRMAHVLPTSSADVEATFSQVKTYQNCN